MRIALVNSQRHEAQPGLVGHCQSCAAVMIAKCGTHRAWHWAHRGLRQCDSWWERETEWHIAWKNNFPTEWQEIIRHDAAGERHIADVQAGDGRVIEFQHSPISDNEKRARETAYSSMVWVVDGLTRKRDQLNFERALQLLDPRNAVFAAEPDACALFRDWINRPVDTFLDFGERSEDVERFGSPVLWHLHPSMPKVAVLRPIAKTALITALKTGAPFWRLPMRVVQPRPVSWLPLPPMNRHATPLSGFGRYLFQQQRIRARRRF